MAESAGATQRGGKKGRKRRNQRATKNATRSTTSSSAKATTKRARKQTGKNPASTSPATKPRKQPAATPPGAPLDPAHELRLIEIGVPVPFLRKLQAALDLSQHQMATALGLPLRTFSARLKETRLNPQDSDRVLSLNRIYALAKRALDDDHDEIMRFLRTPNRSLGSQPPLQLLGTATGARAVEQTLLRIEHGIYA